MAAEAAGATPDGRPTDRRIDRLCAVVVSTARGARGRSVCVGWTEQELPAAATGPTGLTERARAALVDATGPGIAPRQIPYAAVVPLTYVVTGPAVDFADVGRRTAEDQVRYTVVDGRGERREISLGERAVLGAVADARTPWQHFPREAGPGLAVDAVPMYTVFAPMPGEAADTGLALLFLPTLAGSSNEAALRSFIRHTVGRLLVLDESQPPRARRGYLEAAGRLAGAAQTGGSLGTLVVLRRAGMVDFDDDWLAGFELTKRRAKGRLIQAMRGLGLVEVSDEVLDELIHPRPDYDIDRLDLSRLFDLADAMYAVARRALG